MIKSRFLAILPGLLAFAAHAQAPAGTNVTVPFRIIKDSGQRPVIEAVVNTLPVRLVLHSNAGFSMQLSHRAATEGGVQSLYHLDAFGITQVDKVSSLGRDTALVKRFVVGGAVFDQVPAQVFETPAPYTQGMLGCAGCAPTA